MTFNPFISEKVLVHLKYWESIQRGIIPSPIAFVVCPSSACNYGCEYCNSNVVIKKNPFLMNIETMDTIIEAAKYWGTKAITLSGGGEPLLNKNVSHLIGGATDIGVEVAVITNGFNIELHIADLLKCKWIGVSIDAGNKKTYSELKAVDPKYYTKVIENIKMLAEAKDKSSSDVNITAKYLIHPNNYREIFEFVRNAKASGCDNVYIRPGDDPWFTENRVFKFSDIQVATVSEQIQEAKNLYEDNIFKVYSALPKYDTDFKSIKNFKNCWSPYVTFTVDSYGNLEMCCDHLGNKNFRLCHIDKALDLWGSDMHKKLVGNINVSKCRKCTHANFNEMFEKAILEDSLFFNFI
jgi:wyosine [tRNA(Phe)-imidazoG37] synthetase (radical SAM superfamily)